MVPALASAQDKKVNFSVGAGLTSPVSNSRDNLSDGFHVNFGVQVNLTPVIGIEGLYSFSGLGSKNITYPVYPQPIVDGGVPTDFSSDLNMHSGTASLIVQKPDGGVRPYGLVGAGVYHRTAQITTPGVGWVPGFCNPWWYVCYPGGWVETTNIVGERSSTDFGMVFGGGVNFGHFYGEVRYHFIWGPKAQVNQPTQPIAGVEEDKRSANGQFIAATFGFRF